MQFKNVDTSTGPPLSSLCSNFLNFISYFWQSLSPWVMQLYCILMLSLAELLILSQNVLSQALQISILANVFHTYKPIWDLNLVLKYLRFKQLLKLIFISLETWRKNFITATQTYISIKNAYGTK
jgi:hypothetical protein